MKGIEHTVKGHGMKTFVKLVQLPNACVSIVLTLVGIENFVSEEQPLKSKDSIV